MARKLWQVSQILEISPFDPGLLSHNEAQLDFILEMWAKDNPKRGRFVREGKASDGMADTMARKGWADVLRGAALNDYLATQMPPPAVMRRIREMRGSGAAMRRPVRMKPQRKA